MKKLICPDCQGNLRIDHYDTNVKDGRDNVRIHASRLICTKCPYKKEPKQLLNPQTPELMRLIERERGGEKQHGQTKKETNYYEEGSEE
jgi:C4-type Zn-finger protein